MTAVETSSTAAETPQQTKKRLRKVAAATIFGSMLEWYDFYLYATMAAIVFSKIFFDNSNPKSATLMAFSTFAIGFIARPFGGILFGYLGDKFGRKQVLVLTFCLMGVCTALIGLIPSYASIGIWAPILLVAIRIIQGLGAGAELSGAAVTSYEHASEGKRGSQGAWPALGLNLGLLLSSLTIYLLTVGLWVRNSIPETPEFKELSKESQKAKASPLKALFKNDLKGLAVVFFVAVGYNALSYIFKTFSLAYLTQYKNVDVHVTSLSVTIASLIAIVAVPFFGWLCDKWSSKTVLILGGLFSVLFAYPFLALLNTGESLMIYIAIGVGTGILAPMMFAPQGSFLSRQFPTATRSSGFGTGREIGTAIAGGLAPLGALSLVTASATHSTDGVVIILAVAAVLVVVFAFLDQGRKHSAFKN
jgi:MFS family permease